MSPELLDPERFGGKGRPTKSSDCYALGMVVYEVLTGQVPFPRLAKYPAIMKVVRGERPERPEGVEGKWFTDDVWGILGRCWEPEPTNRLSMAAGGYVTIIPSRYLSSLTDVADGISVR